MASFEESKVRFKPSKDEMVVVRLVQFKTFRMANGEPYAPIHLPIHVLCVCPLIGKSDVVRLSPWHIFFHSPMHSPSLHSRQPLSPLFLSQHFKRSLSCLLPISQKTIYRSFSLKRAICHSIEPPNIVKLL